MGRSEVVNRMLSFSSGLKGRERVNCWINYVLLKQETCQKNNCDFSNLEDKQMEGNKKRLDR